MLITDLIEKLKEVKKRDGDIEVMITHFDGVEEYETTAENLFVGEHEFTELDGSGKKEKVVKLTL